MDDLPFTFAPLQVSDIEQMMRIEREAFPTPWSPSIYRYEVTRNQHSHYLTLRSQGEDSSIIGYGGFWLVIDEAHICTLAVDAAWRGYGLGTWLMLALLEDSLNGGATMATLEVRASNEAAQNLYQKLGFSVSGRRSRYYSNNNEDALLMTLEGLPSPSVQAALTERYEVTRLRLLALAERLRAASDVPAQNRKPN